MMGKENLFQYLCRPLFGQHPAT